MRFDIITIFPDIFSSYLKEGLIKTAQKKKYISVNIHNLRDYAQDKHKTVDDTPFDGGGNYRREILIGLQWALCTSPYTINFS